MIHKGQGILLQTVIWSLKLRSRICHGRCKSTKSAIHTALKNSPSRNGKIGRGSLRPRSSTQDKTRSEYLEKQENRFGGRAAKTSQSFQDHQRHSYDNRPNRASDISYKRRTLKKPDHLAHGDGVASHTPTRNIRGARRSVHHVGDQHRVYGSDGATSYPAHSPRTDTSPSLHSFLSQEKTLQLADDKATERRASRSEQQRRSEIDFVGNSRYGINDNKRQQDPEDTEPLRLPYTTPASEFLYGHSVVTAALRARRRKLYKMYIYQSAKRGDEKKDLDMRKMALDLDVPVERVSFDRVRMLDRMSEGRPHNVSLEHNGPLPFRRTVHDLIASRVSY